MASTLKRSYGNRDFKLAELRFCRLHIYSTLAALNADVSTAQGSAVYCIETDRVYFGKTGAWVGLANASSYQDPVANVGALPGTDIDGTVRVVLDDGTGVGPTIWVYSSAHGGWHKQTDPGIVLANGTVKFSGIPGVTSGAVVPTAATDLTTKAYVDAGGAALAAHISDPTAHAAEISTAVSAGVATAEAYSDAQLNAHKTDAGAHAAAIAAAASSAASSAITTHLADGTAHATEINSLIAAHNADPTAHLAGIAGPAAGGGGGGGSSSGGADGAFSLSGQNVFENARIVSGGHGSPCTTRPFESVYRLSTEVEEPCGVIWRPSTQTSYGSGSVTFVAATPGITMTSTAGLVPGQALLFPSSTLNAGIYFTVLSVTDSTHVVVSPAPVNETVTSAMTAFSTDGIVLFGGKYFIDEVNALGAPNVQSATANVGGFGVVVVSSFAQFSSIRAGDQVVIAGTPANDGTYFAKSINLATNAITLTTVLPASQGSPAGTATITHLGQTNNFTTYSASTQKDIPFYVNDADPLGYSTTPSAWELGQQTNSSEFVIRIQRIGATKLTTQTIGASITRKLKQIIPVDTSSGPFTLTLFTGVEGDEVIVIDYGNALNSNNCTIATDGTQQIGPGTSTSFALDSNGESVTLKFIDSKWRLQ